MRDMTAGFVGYRTDVLRKINLDDIRSEGYAFLMEMKFTLHRLVPQLRVLVLDAKLGSANVICVPPAKSRLRFLKNQLTQR